MIWPRIVIAVILLATPVWAGAAGRSLWSLPVLIVVFTLAYIDGKNRIWRERYAESPFASQLGAGLVAMAAQCVLVAVLFFTGAGAAAALGALGERTPYDRLDAGLAAAVLAFCLLGGAALRWAEGGRDPVDRALERLEEAFEDVGDEPADGDEPPHPGSQEWLEQLLAEVEAIERRTLAAEHEIQRLGRCVALATDAMLAIRTLAAIATPGPGDGAGAPGEPHRRRIGLIGLAEAHRRLDLARVGETRGDVADLDRATEELARLSEAAVIDNLGYLASDLVRLEALALCRRAGVKGDRLRASLQAIADAVEPVPVGAPPESADIRRRLRREASELLSLLEAL